jgi:predicted acylesterase/phospholipase RssA
MQGGGVRHEMNSDSTRVRGALVFASILAALLLQACSTPTRIQAVPLALETKAYPAGFPHGMRYFPRDAERVELFKEDFLESWKREQEQWRGSGHAGPLPPSAYLAISGGGDNGAFGAGLLVGWTKAGPRPTFKLVTGVSTGALIAPFAFLGPGYDEKLKDLYTNVSLKDIASERSLFSVVFSDAMADTTPLQNLVRKYVTQEMLEAIAAEHEKGRILLIGTTNLDARRPVIWNVTKIAATRNPKALELIRKILVASAAIPGTFPPVMIDVEAGNGTFQEMHVDGGTTAQVFVYPAAIRLEELAAEHGAERERKLYIIRNARIDPEWAQVDRRTLSIAMKAISCLIQYQGLGDLYRIYSIARRDDVDYNLAFVPPTFRTPHTTEFDTSYMRALFDVGFRAAEAGYSWAKEPPVLLSGVDTSAPRQ